MKNISTNKEIESQDEQLKKEQICPHCGNKGNIGAIYCDKCGFRIQMNPQPNIDNEITMELPVIDINN